MRALLRPFTAALPLLTLAALAAVLAWDATGLDLALARLAGDGRGFTLRDAWFLSQVMHEGARRAAWLGVVALFAWAGWPTSPPLRSVRSLQSVPRSRRLQWAVSALAAAGVVALLKAASPTSCPWDLHDFGGVAHLVSHWSRLADGGPGHCFPVGHASAGFSFAGGWFALRDSHPRAARWVLAGSLLCGVLLGLSQQWRGAHFMSHTLWAGWICWTTAWALDQAVPWKRMA